MSYSDYEAEIKEAYNKIKKEEHRIPRSKEMPHLSVIIRKYQTWKRFVAIMEEKPYYDNVGVISNEKIISEVQALYHQKGYPPRSSDYSRYSTAQKRFGTWDDILNAANIPHTKIKGSNLTVEELDYLMNQIKSSGEDNFTWHHLRAKHHFPVGAAVKAFGSIKGVRKHYHIEEPILHVTRAELVSAYMTIKRQKSTVSLVAMSHYFNCSKKTMTRLIRENNGGESFSSFQRQMEGVTVK